jgi:5-oxoprolinase (ATP-hydrolysing)
VPLALRSRYVGYALTTQWGGQPAAGLQMIGFDMGGTSTDVSRFAGSYEHVFESTTAGLASYNLSDQSG